MRVKGIPPLGETIPDFIAAWIVFEFAVDPLVADISSPFSVKIYEGKPLYRNGCHQAFFGFDEAGIEALTEGHDYYPVYLKFLAFNKARGAQQDVTSWLSAEDENGIGLSACFGSRTFDIVTPLQYAGCKIRCFGQVSIAELIDAYLDNQPECEFRKELPSRNKDLQRRNLGITTCKVEVALSKRGFNQQSERYLKSCDIAFSLLDPDTLTIRRVQGIHLGLSDPDIAPGIRNLDERYFQPLTVSQNPEQRREQKETNYAYCLSRYHRKRILPTEVGTSFLTFSAGEICSYLLHWFLLRIFAYEHSLNQTFARKFQDWLHAVSDRHRRRRLFHELLRTPVLLPVDTNVFKEEVKELSSSREYLGIYDEPIAFGEALNTLGLGNSNGAWIRQTAEFLSHYHTSEDNSDQNLQSLPMFQNLGWSDALLLGERRQAVPSAGDDLEAIIHYLASSFSGEVPDPKTAQEKKAALTRSCVFPIAEALPHLSSSLRLPLYYIFPLWEDTIGQWHGPVIFAHVFTRALPFGSNAPPDQDQLLDMGTELQNLLVPIVSAIAHANYNAAAKKYERIQREAEEQKRLAVAAYKLGHPLKDRVGPLRAIINTLKKELSRMPSAQYLRDEVNNAGDLLTRISQLGHLLDITSVAMMGDTGSDAFLKEGKENVWRVESTYDLRGQIEKLSKLSMDPRGAREIVLMEEDLKLLSGARIEPWISDAQNVLWRPGDLFYDEIISEVLTNAAKYGKRIEGRVTLRLWIGDIGGKRCLLMSNECQKAPDIRKLGLGQNEWRQWNTDEDGSIGGLFYIVNSLTQTKSGSVYANVYDDGGACLFVVGLLLKGLIVDESSSQRGEKR